MRNILAIVQKEFRQIVRNKAMLAIIFAVPTLQLLILPWAATFEMKNIKMHVVDLDNSPTSRELITKFNGSPFYKIVGISKNYPLAEGDMISNKADVILNIPENMERELQTLGSAKVQFVINAINGSVSGLINAYNNSIVADYNADIAVEINSENYVSQPKMPTHSFWFNPQLDYKTYMVPGILIVLTAVIGLFLMAMNTVREKEIGTIEQINVTPIRKSEFVIGKSIPFAIIGLVDVTIGLLLARWVYQVPLLGSVWMVYLTIIVFLFSVLGLGLFFSAISNTQQQAMFLAWFFVMVFILLSGLFTPADNMPIWIQRFNTVNPLYYGIKIVRMIMLKGSSFSDYQKEFFALIVYAIASLSLAMKVYRKTV